MLEFSDAVSGFVSGDVAVTNGTASSLTETMSGTTWTVTVTPDADYAGAVTVTVAADAATNGTGVGNAAASADFEVDTKGPGLSTAVVTGNTLVLTYDEDLDASSVPAGSAYTVKVDGSAVSLAASGAVTLSGRTVTLMLASAVASGDVVTVSYTAPGTNKLQDALGNAAGALMDGAVVNNTAKPTVAIASTGTFPTKDPFGVTLEFSVVVSGFALDDIEASNGTASSLTETVSGTTWTVTVTPDADYAGTVTVSVAADAATNGTGVGNAAASADFEADTKGPGLSTAVVAGNTLVLTYDEDLDASSVPAGSAYAVQAGPSGSLATVNLAGTNPVTVSGRTVTLTLASAVLTTDTVTASYAAPVANPIRDALGNAAVNLADGAVVNDTTKPTVTIESTGTFPTKDAFTVMLEFSDAVSGFVSGDVAVTNGTASSLTETVSGTTWTVTVTPDADYAGTVTVSVAADAATNGTGVGNAAASADFEADTKGPGLSTAVVTGNTLVLTYDEDLDASSVPAGSAYTVQAGPSGSLVAVNLAGTNPVTVSGRNVTLTLASAVASGDVVVTVSYTAPGTNKLQDALGNAAVNLADGAVVNNTAKPTVAITGTDTFPTKDAFTVTLEFSDAVTGFALDDIEVSNGTASSLTETMSGMSWTVTVTPGRGLRGRGDGDGGGGRGDKWDRRGQRGGERGLRGGHQGSGAVDGGGDRQRAGADLRRGSGCEFGAGGQRVHGEGRAVGQSGDGEPGGHESGDGVGAHGDADAGERGVDDGYGDGELHGAGDEQAAGRAGQRGGSLDGPGGGERHDEADGDDREYGYVPDEGRVHGDA